jgi:hypothetical protein
MMNLSMLVAALALLSATQARPRSQKHCEGKHVTTTFRQEVSEPELPTNLGASTTILRTRSIVLSAEKQRQDRTSAANALTYSTNQNRKLPCGQPIDTVLDQEFDCHDDNGKSAKNH